MVLPESVDYRRKEATIQEELDFHIIMEVIGFEGWGGKTDRNVAHSLAPLMHTLWVLFSALGLGY